MLPAAGVPFVHHQLAQAKAAGIDHVVLATSYKAEVFEAHFGDGSSLGLDLEYVTETEPLGTAGGIRNVASRLRGGPGDPVVIFNGDVLSGHDIAAQLALHRSRDAAVTLYLTEVDDPRAFGCVPTDADGRVTAFLEKTPEPVTNRINAGCYVFRRSVIDAIPAGRPVSVERETFPGLLAAGELVVGFVDTSYWLDLGTPEAYVTGCRDLVTGRAPSPAVAHVGESLVLPGASVAPDAWLSGGTSIGAGAVVGAGARVVGSVVFDGARIGAGTLVENSVVGADAVIGAGCVIMDTVIGDGARVGARNELLHGARVWTGAVLADCAVRFSTDG
ncbi:MAG: mannose-phosphate guanylyltransferase [Frankiales bacterium]|jgi:mannose-1-phosphate guanylyltransferase|nr:mannose-phosphate guanylyltransferase [Frankiales bacterium]MDX6222687.1 mannose-phosphate guanylyltransferase [Frankiales bacterium]